MKWLSPSSQQGRACALAWLAISAALIAGQAQAANVNCGTTSCLTNALANAAPGDVITLDAGATFTGQFKATVDGTSSAPITLQSASSTNKATLSGTGTGSGYALHMTGDHWIIKDLKVTNAKKAIMVDNANYTLIDGAEVYNIGEEGIHYRDGSSYNTVQNSVITDCGVVTPDYGEGVYVGSDIGKWGTFIKETDHNVIKNNTIGPGVRAESVDIKEGATGTIVEYNIFNGTGISGANSADSFIDAKGNDGIIRYNTAYRNNNSNINDAFQTNERSPGWGFNTEFTGNTVYMDQTTGYLVNVKAGSAVVCDNTRDPVGDMYLGNYTECSGGGSADTEAPTAPTGVAASAVSSSRIDVTWNASTDNTGVAGYTIFRDGTEVGSSTSTSYSDTGLSGSTTYSYTVRAYDASNNVSPASDAAAATTLASSPASTVHSADIVMSLGSGGGQTWAVATVLVLDNNGNPVANATVNGHWSGMTTDSDSGMTTADGTVTVESDKVKNPAKGTYTFTVDSVSHGTLTYDAQQNVMTSNSITK